MIQVEDPPKTRACSTCSMPLDWVWRHADQRWYAIVRYADNPDPTVVKLHTCPLPGVISPPWKLRVQPPEVWERGTRLANAVLKDIAKRRRPALAAKAKKRTEKEEGPS